MLLQLIAYLAVILLSTSMVVVFIGLFSPDNNGWRDIELVLTSILVNAVMMALLFKQMYDYHTDNKIRIRPWIGRSGNKIVPQNQEGAEMLEILVRNHGATPAMNIEIFTLSLTHDRQLKFNRDMDHDAFALSPREEFGIFMNICDIEKADSIILDNEKVKTIVNRLKIKQGILSHFEKCKNNSEHATHPWFGFMIQYADPTRKIKGAYLVLGSYDRQTKSTAAEILLTI